MTQVASPASRNRPAHAGGTMLAAAIVAPRRVEMQRVPIPEPGPDQVRIQVESCGICGSNLPVWEGREWFTYPLAPGNPGHEPCGWIDAVGELAAEKSGLKVGQRVVALSYNAFAPFDIADASAVALLPDVLAGQPVPGEALGCAVNVFRRSGIQQGQFVAVVGIGFLGAILTQLAAESGARVIAISRRDFALEMASRMGAAVTVPMDDHGKIIDRIRRMTGEQLCDVVIEAVGQQWPLDIASEITRERGRLIIAGYHQDGTRQVNMQMWNWRGLDVINAHERDSSTYVEGMTLAVEVIASGRLDPAPLYTHQFPLEQLGEAMEMVRARPDGFLKACITMDGAS